MSIGKIGWGWRWVGGVVLLLCVAVTGLDAAECPDCPLNPSAVFSRLEITDTGAIDDQLVEAIREGVVARLGVPPSDVAVSLTSPDLVRRLVSIGDRVSLKEASGGRFFGKTSFVMRLQRGDEVPISHWITAKIDVKRPMVQTRHRLKSNHIVRSEDLVLQASTAQDEGYRYASRVEEVVGKKTRKSMEEGVPISLNYLEEVPLIQSGDRVTLLVKNGNLAMTAVGVAKGNGYLHRQVPVMNVDSTKIVYGRVVDAGTVEVGAK